MKNSVGLVYDEKMTKHAHATKPEHPERPSRISHPYQMLQEQGYVEKCKIIKVRSATEEELKMVHSSKHIQDVKSGQNQNPCRIPEKWPTYMSDFTYESAVCAAGCSIALCDALLTGEINSGIALVRPPGHHAEVGESCGFCYFNNVALVAKHAKLNHGINKVLILDWDIHHGNGTQHIFYEDDSVMYISLHRYDNGDYFPCLKEASHDAVGCGKGEGFNINIPWNRDLMGNSEYKAAFDRIVLPIANQFKPDLVLVSAGFDAAAADPLGEYILSPEMFGYMTEKLTPLADGKLLVIMEGGYNEKTIGESLIECLKSLLKEGSVAENDLGLGDPCKRAAQTLASVISTQSKYWDIK